MKLIHSHAKAYKSCASVVAMSAVAASIYLLSPLLITGVHADTPVSVEITGESGYHLTFSTASGATGLNMSLAGSFDGAIASVKDTVSIDSNLPDGWSLYLSSADNHNRRLFLNNDTSSSYFISPTSGTLESPAELDMNSFGYALHEAPFNTTTEGAYTTPTSDSTWAGIRFLEDADIIKTGTENADVDVYFGTKANIAMPAGVYTGNILYSVMGNANDADKAVLSPERARAGDEVTVITSLTTNRPISTDEVEVFLDLSQLGGVAPRANCPVTGIDQSTGLLQIKCVLPDAPIIGLEYKVVATVFPYNKVYTVDHFKMSGPLLNKNGTSINDIKYLQEMNQTICQSLPFETKFTLRDARDSKDYEIARFKNDADGTSGTCWLMNDLSIGPGYYTGSIELDNVYTDAGVDGYTITSGKTMYDGYETGAGTIEMPTISGGNAIYSICPAGWRLPTFVTDVMNLGTNYPTDPIGFSGASEGVTKRWRTATFSSDGGIMRLFNYSGNGSFHDAGGIWIQYSELIRCVAR